MGDKSNTFVLVSCSKSKQEGTRLARNIYEPSRIFRVRRDYARANGDHWGILSAKYGYLRPWERVPYYQMHISERSPVWGAFVMAELLEALEYRDIETVIILAGSKYVEPLIAPLENAGYTVENPNEGLRPGERYSKLKEQLQPGVQSTLDSVSEQTG